MTPAVPSLPDLLERLHVVALPMRVRFRGITTREVALIEGPAGWGEFGAFVEYGPRRGRALAGVGDRGRLPRAAAGAARPHPDQRHRAGRQPPPRSPDVLARFPGARTAKVKVAEPGQTLADDVDRVNAVRELVTTVRVDANGGWSVEEAVRAAAALTADGPLEYLEQPCATVAELAELRAPGATCRSPPTKASARPTTRWPWSAPVPPTSRCSKSLRWAGFRRCLYIAAQIDIPIVVSSALDSAVGIGRA